MSCIFAALKRKFQLSPEIKLYRIKTEAAITLTFDLNQKLSWSLFRTVVLFKDIGKVPFVFILLVNLRALKCQKFTQMITWLNGTFLLMYFIIDYKPAAFNLNVLVHIIKLR